MQAALDAGTKPLGPPAGATLGKEHPAQPVAESYRIHTVEVFQQISQPDAATRTPPPSRKTSYIREDYQPVMREFVAPNGARFQLQEVEKFPDEYFEEAQEDIPSFEILSEKDEEWEEEKKTTKTAPPHHCSLSSQ